MYKTILVPVDLSHLELGRKMIEIAREIGKNESRIFLLHVLEAIPAFVASQLPEGLLQNTRASAVATLREMAPGAGVGAEVRSGHAHLTILDYADEIGAELIIIASHRPGLQDYFLGSTAARVVRHAKCAVLVDR